MAEWNDGLFEEYEAFDEYDEAVLIHYGTKRHSGRYPWGSGQEPYQHGSGDFLSRIDYYRSKGLSDTQIANALNISKKDFDGAIEDAQKERATYNEQKKFLKMVSDYRNSGMSDPDIAARIGEVSKSTGKPSSVKLRADYSIARSHSRAYELEIAKALREKGCTLTEIANALGKPNESSIRSLFSEAAEKNMEKAINAAVDIESVIKDRGIIDISLGVERELGISRTKLDQSIEMMRDDGYEVYPISFKQPTNPTQKTNVLAACPPGTSYHDAYEAIKAGKVGSYTIYESADGTKKLSTFKEPESISSDRIIIRYAEDGGKNKDGLIEIRRGVEDLDLGNDHYAQVRIAVDGDHYLKGMAIYSDNVPKGYDVLFNTNKSNNKSKMQVLKEMERSDDGEIDKQNPFGATIKEKTGQSEYIGKDGKTHLSAINKVHNEGDWDSYRKSLPAQFLAKQSLDLIKSQLDLTKANKRAQLEAIESLTNPTLKRYFLKEFADGCDNDAATLDAAALPRQRYQVILPLEDIKDHEVYAPNYKDGEYVALVRFPHESTSQIPVLKVNNKNVEGRKMIGPRAVDAIGINGNVAEKMSGADFDGDYVMVIPTTKTGKNHIVSKDTFAALKGYDAKDEYPGVKMVDGKEVPIRPGIKYMSKDYKQKQMGIVSNLITDMTILGAPDEEIAYAIRHANTVIDAYKHKLDYKLSEEDNHIKELKAKWQGRIDPETGRYTESASTLISRSKREVDAPETKGQPHINDDGSLDWNYSKRTYIDPKTGKEVLATKKVKEMYTVTDAYDLVSGPNHEGTPVEHLYADYANYMKAMGNEARKKYKSSPRLEYNKSAKETYAKEVKELEELYDNFQRNKPRERQAGIIATGRVNAIIADNPSLNNKENKKKLKKIRNREMLKARDEVSASSKNKKIKLTDRQWEAIQSGAIHDTTLMNILSACDTDSLYERAMPRATKELTDGQKARIIAMAASTFTNKEIAEEFGISVSTVSKILNSD